MPIAESLKGLLDVLKTFRTINRERRDDYIKLVLDPLLVQLEKVHDDYKESFRSYFELLREPNQLAETFRLLKMKIAQDMALSRDLRIDLWGHATGIQLSFEARRYLDLAADVGSAEPIDPCSNKIRVTILSELSQIEHAICDMPESRERDALAREMIRCALEAVLATIQLRKSEFKCGIVAEKLKPEGTLYRSLAEAKAYQKAFIERTFGAADAFGKDKELGPELRSQKSEARDDTVL